MARVQGRAALPILARIFGSLGVAMLLVAGTLAWFRSSAIAARTHADGTVVELTHYGKGFRPVVEFTPASGQAVRFTSVVASNPPAFRVGERVGVYFDVANPGDAFIDTFWQLWFLPMIFTLIGAPLALLGLGMFMASKLKPAS